MGAVSLTGITTVTKGAEEGLSVNKPSLKIDINIVVYPVSEVT